MKRIIFAVAVVLASVLAKGESTVGNGGIGVRMNDRVVLLDLLEAGVAENPIHSPAGMKSSPSYLMVTFGLPFLSSRASDILAVKLTEIRSANPFLADVLATAIHQYTWRLLPEALVPIEESHSPIDVEPSLLVQLATRTGSTIRINKDQWARLDDVNQAALVLHEVVYGVLPPRAGSQGAVQDGLRAREMTGFLFTEELRTKGWAGLMEMAPVGYRLSHLVDAEMPWIEFDPTAWLESTWMEGSQPGSERVSIRLPGSSIQNEQTIRTFCSKVLNQMHSNLRVRVTYEVKALRPTFQDYSSPAGPKRYLAVDDSGQDIRHHVLAADELTGHAVSSCVDWVSGHVESYSTGAEYYW